MNRTIKWYLSTCKKWTLEWDEGEVWFRTEKGMHLIDLGVLEMIHIASGDLLKEAKECN